MQGCPMVQYCDISDLLAKLSQSLKAHHSAFMKCCCQVGAKKSTSTNSDCVVKQVRSKWGIRVNMLTC